MLDDGVAHQFWSGLEEILLFANFGNSTQKIWLKVPRGTQCKNGLHFWIQSDGYMRSMDFLSFWGIIGPPKGQKNPLKTFLPLSGHT